MPRLACAARLRDRGLSYRDIHEVIDEFFGDAPSAQTIRNYLIKRGYPKNPRGYAEGNFK